MIADKRIEFYKGIVKEKIEQIKEMLPDIKYRLYMTIVEACDDLDKIKQMADFDMQIEMLEYIRKINNEMDLAETTIEELEEVCSGAYKVRITVEYTEEEKEKIEQAKNDSMETARCILSSTEEDERLMSMLEMMEIDESLEQVGSEYEAQEIEYIDEETDEEEYVELEEDSMGIEYEEDEEIYTEEDTYDEEIEYDEEEDSYYEEEIECSSGEIEYCGDEETEDEEIEEDWEEFFDVAPVEADVKEIQIEDDGFIYDEEYEITDTLEEYEELDDSYIEVTDEEEEDGYYEEEADLSYEDDIVYDDLDDYYEEDGYSTDEVMDSSTVLDEIIDEESEFDMEDEEDDREMCFEDDEEEDDYYEEEISQDISSSKGMIFDEEEEEYYDEEDENVSGLTFEDIEDEDYEEYEAIKEADSSRMNSNRSIKREKSIFNTSSSRGAQTQNTFNALNGILNKAVSGVSKVSGASIDKAKGKAKTNKNFFSGKK